MRERWNEGVTRSDDVTESGRQQPGLVFTAANERTRERGNEGAALIDDVTGGPANNLLYVMLLNQWMTGPEIPLINNHQTPEQSYLLQMRERGYLGTREQQPGVMTSLGGRGNPLHVLHCCLLTFNGRASPKLL